MGSNTKIIEDKIFSESDMIKAIELACEKGMEIQRTINDKVKIPFTRIIDYRREYIKSITNGK